MKFLPDIDSIFVSLKSIFNIFLGVNCPSVSGHVHCEGHVLVHQCLLSRVTLIK